MLSGTNAPDFGALAGANTDNSLALVIVPSDNTQVMSGHVVITSVRIDANPGSCACKHPCAREPITKTYGWFCPRTAKPSVI